MDTTTLLDLIDRFYRTTFAVATALGLFGPVALESENTVTLAPPAGSPFASVTLEMLRDKAGAPPFLAGVSIRFKEPPLIDFAVLAQRHGPGEELPRLKPTQDIPYRFLIQGADYSGYVLCLVPATPDAQEPRRTVNNLILRRFPPGQK